MRAPTRLTVVNPNISDPLTATISAAAVAAAPEGVQVSVVRPTTGVPGVESAAEEAYAAVGLLELVRAHDGASDAFVVACFGDTGVAAAREVATGPVVGMTEAALATACMIAERFVVVTLPPRTIAMTDRVVRAMGLGHRAVVRAVDVHVGDLEGGSTPLRAAFAEQVRAAVAADATIEAVVLGCAGLSDLVGPLSADLGLPVVEGVAAAVGIAAALVRMGVTTSRANTYAPLPHLPRATLVVAPAPGPCAGGAS